MRILDGRKANKGRPPKMTKHDERLILRTIKQLNMSAQRQ